MTAVVVVRYYKAYNLLSSWELARLHGIVHLASSVFVWGFRYNSHRTQRPYYSISHSHMTFSPADHLHGIGIYDNRIRNERDWTTPLCVIHKKLRNDRENPSQRDRWIVIRVDDLKPTET